MFEDLKEILRESKYTVFFTGAGVSTESGIPDFRSADGIYRQPLNEKLHRKVITPEEIISHSFFERFPEAFYDFYKEKLIYPDAQPNGAHLFMAKAEEAARKNREAEENGGSAVSVPELFRKLRDVSVVTQNIDGLHQKAGSRNVYELHGSVLRNYCMRCGKAHGAETVLNTAPGTVPRCSCGGIIRPDVVLYEETLDDDVVSAAVHKISKADTLIIGGTSLAVYPAAGLLRYFNGRRLVLINKSETQADSSADLVIREAIGSLFETVMKEETL